MGKYAHHLGVLCALVLTTQASATINDRTVTYTIHKTPGDAQSGVAFTAEFELMAYDVDEDKTGPGGTVKWQVERAILTEVVTGGADRVWVEMYPDVDTWDGYWTLYHADLADVSTDAFDDPPLISGVAVPSGHSASDLEYDFETSGGSGTDPYTHTAYINWLLILTGESSPLSEESDGPVDVDDVETT